MLAALRKASVSVCALILFLSDMAAGSTAVPADWIKRQSIMIANGDLSVLFRDNSESPAILSGIQSLFNHEGADGFDAYDPDTRGASAGMNFEHIISGHRNASNRFTPRHGRYDLYRLPGGHSVTLVRQREDSPWDVSSTLRYTVTEPHAVDVEFRCTAHNPDLFGERRYAIFFFANYMNDVEDVSLHFMGVDQAGGPEQWIAADAPQGHRDWKCGGTYRHLRAGPLAYDKDVAFRLNSWSYDWPRFTKPLYYGRAGSDMALILMFNKACSVEDQVRFSLFKFKLPKHPRPAWDFQYVINQVEQGREYGFKARLVWKRFVSAEDCLREYEKWRSEAAFSQDHR